MYQEQRHQNVLQGPSNNPLVKLSSRSTEERVKGTKRLMKEKDVGCLKTENRQLCKRRKIDINEKDPYPVLHRNVSQNVSKYITKIIKKGFFFNFS